MIDLIKEIEKLKVYECEFERSQQNIVWMKDCYIKEDLENLLNQYNIITAPKEIKLSEIVSKLENSLNNPKNKVNVYRENENEIVIKITYFARGTFVNEATIEMSNKIWDIDGLMSARCKWLYTLWIAGTTIIDDLEGQDEK